MEKLFVQLGVVCGERGIVRESGKRDQGENPWRQHLRSPKKQLSFGSLIHGFEHRVEGIPDQRQEAKISYRLWDLVGSGLAGMFFQDRSLLQFQKRLADAEQRSNLQTLFGVQAIPEET